MTSKLPIRVFTVDQKKIQTIFCRENGLEPDIDSYAALLIVYGEAGDMEAIMKVFIIYLTN